MTEQVSEEYCEVCGIEVRVDTDLKRFGKLFCSQEHMEQYVRIKQRDLGLDERHERRRIRFGSTSGLVNDNVEPSKLRGLRQAAYVLDCLIEGKTESEIAITLEGDKQLARMWVSFLLHNHWVQQQMSDDRTTHWVVTNKGIDLLKKCELAAVIQSA